MKFGFLSKIFEGVLSIEKTYNQCDKALGALRAYNEKRKQENAPFSASEKAELNNIVDTAIENATRIVEKEGERNWPGVFREMHKNLANIYLELDEYDKVREACERLQNYGEVGKLDAEEVIKNLNEREHGESSPTPEETQSTPLLQ
ncbi:hypothetical protein C6501_19160 [Candidatus Poribacteria bacterium]|nr:MAG: hypothetical protein C6501_19160 [Candidatus Poribacteria bacterium]